MYNCTSSKSSILVNEKKKTNLLINGTEYVLDIFNLLIKIYLIEYL